MMNVQRVGVFGLGRSGLAVARAAVSRGFDVVVFDEKPEDAIVKREVLDEARSAGLRLVLGYHPSERWFEMNGWEPEIVVSNPAVRRTHPALAAAIAQGIDVISEVEFAYRISAAPIVAITGTNGKSTTTVMTALCLRACGVDAVLCGNIFGSGYPEVPLTDAAANSTSDQILVAEISSFQLEWVSKFRPVAVTITNITPDHLDRYESFEEYAETKWKILEAQTASDWAVLHAGFTQLPASRLLRFGEPGGDAYTSGGKLHVLEAELALTELPFAEPHNLLNAMCACLLTGAAMAGTGRVVHPGEAQWQALEGLKTFRGLAHRMETLGARAGVTIINNSMCTNPAAVVASAKSVPGNVHLLIGGTNKELDFEPLAAYLRRNDAKAYLFGADAADLGKMLGETYPSFCTMDSAFEAAVMVARAGETIMLAPGCASTDQFRDFRDRGDVFKAIAKEWLFS